MATLSKVLYDNYYTAGSEINGTYTPHLETFIIDLGFVSSAIQIECNVPVMTFLAVRGSEPGNLYSVLGVIEGSRDGIHYEAGVGQGVVLIVNTTSSEFYALSTPVSSNTNVYTTSSSAGLARYLKVNLQSGDQQNNPDANTPFQPGGGQLKITAYYAKDTGLLASN